MAGGITNRTQSKIGAAGPLSSLDDNPFTSPQYQYPIDIEDLAHAMIFNINVATASIDINNLGSNEITTNIQSRSQQLRNGNFLGTTLTLPPSSGDPAGSAGTTLGTLNQKTTQIQTTISLYVPENLIFQEHEQYESPDLLKVIGAGGLALTGRINGIGDRFVQGMNVDDILAVGLFAAQAVDTLGARNFVNNATDPSGAIQVALKAGKGYAINPVVEVLYSHPTLREFQFDFNFAPRSPEEADAVWNIIQAFRYYKAPSYTDGLGIQGSFFIPPAQFDITFVQNTGSGYAQNNNIPSIDTCVLLDIITNYNPENQFTTFNDGMPVHIHLMLRFRELDILTSDRIAAGF